MIENSQSAKPTPEAIERIRIIIESLSQTLVDNPNHCHVTANVAESSVVYSLKVHPTEVGKIVGKAGSMANALKVLIKSLGAKNKVRAILEIVG